MRRETMRRWISCAAAGARVPLGPPASASGGRHRRRHAFHRGERRRGSLAVDAVFGLAIIGIVAVLFVKSSRATRAARDHLADARAAGRLAERAMLAAAAGRPVPDGCRVAALAGTDAPAGRTWATAEATVRGRRATLVGLVPTEPKGGDRASTTRP